MGNAPTESNPQASDAGRPTATQADATIYGQGDVDALATAILNVVSEATGVPSTEMDRPLYDVVDLDALNRLFYPRLNGTPRTGGTVSFSYYDCTVILETSPDSITVSASTQ